MLRFWTAPFRGLSSLVRDQEDGRILAVLRISIGLVVGASLLEMLWTDTVRVVWFVPKDGGISVTTPYLWTWRTLLPSPSATVVQSLVWGSLAASVAVTVGLAGRLSVGLLLFGYCSLRSLNPPSTAGYDALMVNGLIFLLLGPVTRTWSVDCRLKTGRWHSDRPVPSWPRYVFVFQLVILYFATGLKKASVVWTPAGGYTALYYVLHDVTWFRFESPELLRSLVFMTRVGTAVTWHWEQLAPGILLLGWARRTRAQGGWLRGCLNRYDLRVPYLLVGFFMHLGIFVATQVGPFSAITLAYYPALFGPEELHRKGRNLARWMRRRGAA